ncbi:MAG TPA: phosphoglucosamine mutase, partial [Gammaproteobacteria bacterium]|nr:phosphoglucosamine mutase [Gammaproteobacteria bacterium]
VMVDASGRIFDGDDLLYVIATDRAARGALSGAVVGTVMSNIGLEMALNAHDINFDRTHVGDRHVLARLQEVGGLVGGESSGHIVCLDSSTTGDGIIAGLAVLAAVVKRQKSLAEICEPFIKHPQVLENVVIDGVAREAVLADAELRKVVEDIERKLGDSGRILLRPSGTEALIRVMVEGPDEDAIRGYAKQIAEAVTRAAQR